MDLMGYVSLQVSVIKFCGMWFYIPHAVNSMTFWTNVLYRIFVGIFIFGLAPVAQIMSLITMNGDVEIQEAAGIINLFLTELLTSFKLLDICLRRHSLMELVNQMNNEEFNSVSGANLETVERSIRVARLLYKAFLFSVVSDVFVHVIVMPAIGSFSSLPLKMDFLFFQVNDYFEYVYAYQILYKPLMVVTFATLQSLPWMFMICAIGQLDVLIYNFDNMRELIKETKSKSNCDENEAFERIFKKCLRHHCVIKRFISGLQATFNGQFTSTLAFNAGILCTTGVQILAIESPLQNAVELFWVLLYILVFVFILYIDCFLGNYITIKSGCISTAVYNCPWMNLKPELKRSVIIFIAETQRPLVISAGLKLLPVSLETFTKVMNWSYKAFALMNQMKE